MSKIGGEAVASIQTSIMLNDMMSRQFNAMNMAMSSVISSFRAMETASGNAIDTSALEAAQRELSLVESEFSQIEDEIRRSANMQNRLNNEISQGERASRKLLGALASVAATYLSIQGLGKLINLSDDFTDRTARINLAIGEMPVFPETHTMNVKIKGINEAQKHIDTLERTLTMSANLDATEVHTELKALEKSLINVDVTTDTKQLADLSSSLSQIRDNSANIAVSVDNPQAVAELQSSIDNIQRDIDIKLAVSGMSEIEQAQAMIFGAAQRAYASFGDMSDLVGRLSSNAKDAFGSLSEVVSFAELVQKQFAIAGVNQQEASNATLQLSQALASGVLRGDELNSIFEQAPNLIGNIAKYLEVPIGKIREMAADGEITAQIVKNAMFAAADDINAKFGEMPTTWGQIWTSFKNEATWAFQDVFGMINDLANSQQFQVFLASAKQSLYVLAAIVMQVFEMISSIGTMIYNNWSFIAPVVGTATAAMFVFVGALAAARLASMLSTVWLGLKTLAMGLYTATTWSSVTATLSATAAAWGLNTALYANPIFWVVMGFVIFIGILYLGVAVFNYFAGTSISATGIVMGAIFALGAFVHNVFVYIYNTIASVVEFFANVWTEPVYSVKKLLGNLANNAIDMASSMIDSFDSAATNLANLFIAGANKAVSAVNWLIDALNEIPGVDIGKMSTFATKVSLGADTSKLKNKVDSWVGEAPSGYWTAPKLEFKSLGDSFGKGYDLGSNLFGGGGVGGPLTPNLTGAELANFTPPMPSGMGDLGGGMGDIADKLGAGNKAGKDTAKNTGKLANDVGAAAEDLAYLRDLASRESINRFTTAEINIDMKNENNINNELDIDGVIDRFGEKLEETVASVAGG